MKSRVSLLAVVIDGQPDDIHLDTTAGSDPIVKLAAGISLHCAAGPDTLLALAAALTKAARYKERRQWLRKEVA